jgi:hypothetical protein
MTKIMLSVLGASPIATAGAYYSRAPSSDPHTWPPLEGFADNFLRIEIKRLRRCLGIRQSIEAKRAANRERVRRHRERKRLV